MAKSTLEKVTHSAARRNLIFAVVICCRLLADGSQVVANSTTERAQQTTTGCDSLFIANEKLAKYCLCDDGQQPPLLAERKRISQLNCQPNDLGSLGEDLAAAAGAWGQDEAGLTSLPQIDYLNINTNITSAGAQSSSSSSSSSFVARGNTIAADQRRLFQIDHISLQFQTTPRPRDESSRPHESKSSSSRNQAETSRQQIVGSAQRIENEMIDFCGLINETHLQFLSISIGGDDNDEPTVDEDATEFRLTNLLAKLSSLTRFEFNLNSRKCHSLVIERETFRQQSQLKWLNLASNRQLKLFDSLPQATQLKKRSPFAWATQLEYLSVESCNLRHFPLFSLFQIQFKLASSQQQQQQPLVNTSMSSQLTTKSVFGLPNLTTLNLASNKLNSLERDLFASIDNATDSPVWTICQDQPVATSSSRVFVLPSLTQLDLSENRLQELTFRAGQYILCTMPNLSQLFLRRNNIKHLNLNSLLVYPTILPQPLADNKLATLQATGRSQILRSSRLEYLDLSTNQLIHLSAFVPPVQESLSYSTRIKSINLGQNKLTRLITLINSTLIDRLLFDESFNYNAQSDNIEAAAVSLNKLSRAFSLSSAARLSMCDYLSPKMMGGGYESLVNEIIINENRLTRITNLAFHGSQCADIQILRLSANTIQSISDGAFEPLINLEQLDLSSNELNNLETGTFSKNTKLRVLNLSGNKIKTLDKKLFASLEDLDELFLQDNELAELPGELFLRTTRLSVLNLSNNRLTYLDESIFSAMTQLQALNLNDNRLKNGNYPSLFRHVDNGIVKTINMVILHRDPKKSATKPSKKQKQPQSNSKATNQIEQDGHRKVKTRRNRETSEASNNVLDLSRNHIEALNHANSLDSCNNQTFLVNVETLWLNGNKLRELKRDSFTCFHSIRRLYLQSNHLETLDDSTFGALLELEYVDMSKNQLTQVNLFKMLPQSTLKHADLSHNKLNSLILTTAVSETQLEFLDASHNANLSIDTLSLVKLMSKNPSFRSLRINGIKSMQSGHVDNSTQVQAAIRDRLSLERLDLSGISLDPKEVELLHHFLSSDQIGTEALFAADMRETIKHEAMQRLIASRLSQDLQQLNLSGNQVVIELLKSIIDQANGTDLSLKHLNVSSSLIEFWPFSDTMAAKLANLRSLDLSKNKIRYLISSKNDSRASYTLGQLEHLDLSHNAMIGLIAQPPTQNMQRLGLSRLMPSISSIDLSHNRLSWIPTQFFDGLSELVRLRLDHNQIETFPSNLLLATATNPRKFAHFYFDHNQNMRSLVSPITPDERTSSDEDITGQQHRSGALLDADDPDLIVTVDRSNGQIRCMRVDEYVGELTHRQKTTSADDASVDSNELHISSSAGHTVDSITSRKEASDDEQCQILISLTRSFSFNSIGPNASANLLALWGQVDLDSSVAADRRLYDLSFRRNDMRSIDGPGGRMAGIIRMDLSENRIERLPASPESVCSSPDLLTLDMSHNEIREYALDWSLHCAKLTLLDLSHNRISSLASKSGNGKETSGRGLSLLVLKLDHNSLTNLDGLSSYLLDGLRVLDLRSNKLKTLRGGELELQRPLLTVIYTNGTNLSAGGDMDRPEVRVEDTSMRFVWAESDPSKRYTIGVTSGGSVSYREIDRSIKFCRLDPKNLTQVCLHNALEDQEEGDRCILLKIPQSTKPCLTNLQQPQAVGANSSQGQRSDPTSSHQLARGRNLTADADSRAEEDLVLSLIDSMKRNWLRLKEVDINEFLSDKLKANSVWVDLSDRYHINTLAVIKLAIVIGSVCIVGLLIAIFTLLTYFSHSKIGPADSDSGSASELTTVTNPDSSTSFTSSCDTNQNRSMVTDCSNRSSDDGSRTRNSLQSSSEDTQRMPETVLERTAADTYRRSLDNNILQQQQRPQICVTPSSSLAPSSIETAETMQAVDSIQSGTPNMVARASVDQYTSAAEMASAQQDLYQQQQQQQQQQLATVMRMVKSNSANFEHGAQNQSRIAPNHYGTLNSRHPQNYSTLRAKLRQYNQAPIQHHQTVDQQASIGDISHYTVDNRDHQTHDPATMSLLSLSSALSNSSLANNFAANLQSNNPNLLPSSHYDQQQQHLCQYHSNIMQHNDQQPTMFHHHQQAPPEVIFEQEEDQQQQQSSSYNLDPSLQLSVHNLPPPPPPPRTMEALELYDATNSGLYK